MPDNPRLSRRSVVLGAIGLTAGCAMTDPRVHGSADRAVLTATPSPAPSVEYVSVVAHLDRLSAAASSDASASGKALAAAFGQQLAQVKRLWEVQATAPPLDTLGALLPQAITSFKKLALTAGGRDPMIPAMLAAFCAGARSLARANVTTHELASLAPVADTEAMSSLLAQVHAAQWTYLTAMGAFTLAADARDPFEQRQSQLRSLRDRLTAILTERGVEAPAAAVAYQVNKPDSPAAAVTLVRGVEQRLLPFVGAAVLADTAKRPADRALLIDGLIATTMRLVATGGPLPLWPGQPA